MTKKEKAFPAAAPTPISRIQELQNAGNWLQACQNSLIEGDVLIHQAASQWVFSISCPGLGDPSIPRFISARWEQFVLWGLKTLAHGMRGVRD